MNLRSMKDVIDESHLPKESSTPSFTAANANENVVWCCLRTNAIHMMNVQSRTRLESFQGVQLPNGFHNNLFSDGFNRLH